MYMYIEERWNAGISSPVMGLLQLRFEHDSSTIQHPTRSYVLSSNNEHVNSFALLQDVVANQRSRGGASIYTMMYTVFTCVCSKSIVAAKFTHHEH